MTGQAKMPKGKFNDREFRKALKKYYGAKAIMDGIPKAHCFLVGWCESNDAIASDIVPRILKPEELVHLYGVAEVVLDCLKICME